MILGLVLTSACYRMPEFQSRLKDDNSLIVAPTVIITPGSPVTTDDLTCSITSSASNPDGQQMNYTYQWYKNDVLQTELTTDIVDSAYTAKGEIWKCVVTASDGVHSDASGSDEVTILNSTPTTPGVQVTPDFPTTTDTLVCSIATPGSDPDGDSVAYTYQWYNNDLPQITLTSNTVDASYTAKGEVWKCVVAASDGIDSSGRSFDEVTVQNSKPTGPGVNVIPDSPVTTDDLVCTFTAPSTDPDGDSVTHTYQWYKDGVLQPELTTGTVASCYTAEGEIWRCVVTVNDNTNTGAGGFDEVTIGAAPNSPPSSPVVQVTPQLPVTIDDLVCSIIMPSTDPDGDTVVYAYHWNKNGILQPELTTDTVVSSYTTKGDAWQCLVTAGDGTDCSAGGFDEVSIINSPPTAPIVDVTPDTPTTTSELMCSITTPSLDLDDDPITYTYRWYRDSVLQSHLSSNTVDRGCAARGELWECVVTASDGTDCSSAFDEVTISLKVNALYIWGYYYQVLQYEDEREHFFQICEAENIDTVWFQVDGDTRKFLENYPGLPKDAIPTFLREAKSMGIEVHALLGGPNSLLGKCEPLKSYVEMILKYNEEHPDARFAGIHFDIEGNDTGWTQSQLLRKWVSFMHALKTWSHKDYPGKTVITQELILSLYEAYPPGCCGSTTQEWIDYVSEFDLVCLQVYGFDREERMFGRPDILEKEGLPFVFLLETDELDREHERYTFYEEGRDAFYTAMSGLDEYYSDNYGLFRGFGMHHYERAISTWHTIESVTWPSGELRPGQEVSLPVRLRVSDDCSLKAARGVELQIRDSEGHTWKTGRIAVLPQRGSKDITLQWTVPEDATSGSYDAKVTVYDLDWYRGTRDPLYQVYGDFVKRYHLASIENLTLGEFSDLVKGNPNIFYGVGRKSLIVLDCSGWRESCFAVV